MIISIIGHNELTIDGPEIPALQVSLRTSEGPLMTINMILITSFGLEESKANTTEVFFKTIFNLMNFQFLRRNKPSFTIFTLMGQILKTIL